MIVGRKLRIQFTQAVKESRMDLFKMGLDPVPVIVELDIIVYGFQYMGDIITVDYFFSFQKPVYVFFDQADNFIFLADKDGGCGQFTVNKVQLHLMFLLEKLVDFLFCTDPFLQSLITFFFSFLALFDLGFEL